MKEFVYKAKDLRGKIKEGSIKSASSAAAKKRLTKRKLRVLSITEEKKASSSNIGEEKPILSLPADYIYRDGAGNVQIKLSNPPPSVKEIVVFTKQLATMINSGVPLIQSLNSMKKQQTNRFFCKALSQIEKEVEEGIPFSEALKKHPKIFDDLFIAMVEAGEESGRLDAILTKLVSYIEKAARVKSQVKSALAYPIGVLVIAVIIVSGLLVFVVPVFAEQYSDSGKELPGLTQVIINFSDFLIANWWVFIALAAGFYLLFKLFISTEKGRAIFDHQLLKAPVIGPLLQKIAVGRFCSTLSSMLNSGVNLLEALNICASSAGNKSIEKFVYGVKSELEKGEKLSKPLAEGDLFPDMVISMVEVGEATGQLDEMLEKVSDFYEEEVDVAIATMLSLIEPIMIVFIGGIVGFIVVAMYLPVFDMASAI